MKIDKKMKHSLTPENVKVLVAFYRVYRPTKKLLDAAKRVYLKEFGRKRRKAA